MAVRLVAKADAMELVIMDVRQAVTILVPELVAIHVKAEATEPNLNMGKAYTVKELVFLILT